MSDSASNLFGWRQPCWLVSFLVAVSIFSIPVVAEEGERARNSVIEEVIVTAQKREQSINDVGMSIQTASGEKLKDLGITDTADLFKVVSGFNSNVTYYGTSIYTIRGVGFQDTALASGPTVSVYRDQMPLPFSALTQGVILDLQRVEVLKGPQGTLFGQNSTGGAVNYIANKPTDEFESGVDFSYGRFNEVDVSGFVSGQINETLRYRLAARNITSDGWQEAITDNPAQDPFWTAAGRSYTRSDDEWGAKDFTSYRLSLDWQPTETFSALFTFSGFVDESQSQAPQLYGIASLNPDGDLNPLIANAPRGGNNNRDADWGPCVNVAGGDPALVFTRGTFIQPAGYSTTQTDVDGNGLNLNNRLYDFCEDAERDNDYFNASLRMDWDINDDITITSLTSFGEFNRDQQLESDGTFYQDYESSRDGFLDVFFQEIRVAGSFDGGGTWVVGANYEDTSTWDSFIQTYGMSSAIPTLGNPLGPTNPNNRQNTETWAVFASFDYPVRDDLVLQLGARYTDQKRDYRGCGGDAGDGTWSDISEGIQFILQGFDPSLGTVSAGPGGCGSTGPAPSYHPIPTGFTNELNEDNTSWRAALNWEAAPESLYYVSISQGYKSGSFPTVAAAASLQLEPTKQEDLLAYEVGAKLTLAEGRVQLNVAAFYYDYTDKQILAAVPDIIFGSLPALVNVPESEVIGAEASLEWYPIEGLRIAPSVSYSKSETKGTFESFDPFFNPVNNAPTKDFSGQAFPNAPEWQANIDVQYEWSFSGGLIAFVGMNANFQDATTGFFVDECKDPNKPCTREKSISACVVCDPSTVTPNFVGNTDMIINERLLVDIRAGVESNNWRVWAWGRNVTDKYYWNQVAHVNDVLLRFTGNPRTFGVSVSYRFGS